MNILIQDVLEIFMSTLHAQGVTLILLEGLRMQQRNND